MPCRRWQYVATAISSVTDISEVLGCHLLQQMSSQRGSQKLLQGWVPELTAYLFGFNLFLTQWIMDMLSKGCKRDNFEPHNSLKLSFTNIWVLHSNFVEYESFLESNSPNILAICETNLDDSIDSGNFSVQGYVPLIRKDYITHMHRLISRKLCRFLLMFSTSFASLSILLLFPLLITFFVIMNGFWYYFI